MKMKNLFTFLALSVITGYGLNAQPKIQLVSYATGLSVPVDIKSAGDDRLFVVEQSGKIKIIKNGVVQPREFINLSTKAGYVISSEQGLLGLAFPPDYATSGLFYVHYTNPSGDSRVARYSVSPNDPDSAVLSSEQIVLSVNQPYGNHNGGNLEFGPDSMLYIGFGDGGSANDPQANGQNKLTFLGKMLRIDVRNTSTYNIPSDNPFIGFSSILNEIWAIGLRNPWRYSFDKMTGDLWIGDVGQNAWEEIDFAPAGSGGGYNYGWRCYEGNHPKNTSGCQPQAFYDEPLFEYAQSGNGCSVTGGYVYRGTKYGNMFGKYFYADYCTGKIWYLEKVNNVWTKFLVYNGGGSYPFTTFGQDNKGELYIAKYNSGVIYRITDTTACKPVAFLSNDNSVYSCKSSYTLSTPFDPNFQYQWFYNGSALLDTVSSVTTTQSGAYYVTVTDSNGCSNTSTVLNLVIDPNANAKININDTSVCNYNASLTLTAMPSGGQFSGPGITGNTFNPAAANIGTNFILYSYVDTIGNCNWMDTVNINVSVCTGIAANEVFTNSNVYPNPAKDEFQYSFHSKVSEQVTLQLSDINGNIMLERKENISLGQNQISFSRNGLAAGVYQIVLKSVSGISHASVHFE